MLDAILPEIVERATEVFEFEKTPEVRRIDSRRYVYSEVSRVELVSGDRSHAIFVKRATIDDDADDPIKSDVAAEFRILDELYSHFRDVPNLSVVRPVAVLPEYNVIVTEEAPGPGLMALIGRAVRRLSADAAVEKSAAYCLQAGQWLQHFQGITGREAGEFNIDGLVQYCDIRLKSLLESGAPNCERHSLDAGFRDTLLRHLRELAQRLEPAANKICGRHNDFSPHNIIASDGGITVFDFGFFDYESFAYDVYRFWHHLDCMNASPILSRGKIERLQEAFLAGYGAPVDLRSPVFRLAACRFNLVRLDTLATKPAASGPRDWIDRRLFARCHAWLARECGLD